MPLIITDTQIKDSQNIDLLQYKIKLFLYQRTAVDCPTFLDEVVQDIVNINVNVLNEPLDFIYSYFVILIREFNSIISQKDLVGRCQKIIEVICRKIIEIFALRVRKSHLLASITVILKDSLLLHSKQQKKKKSIYDWQNEPKLVPTAFYPNIIKLIIDELQSHIKVIWHLQLKDITELIEFINNLTASALHQNKSKLLIQNITSQINAFFKSGRQDLIKYADKNEIEKLREMIQRRMRKDKEFDLLNFQKGLNLSYTLLVSQYPKNQTAGFKLLDKLVYEYTCFSNNIKCDMLITWMTRNDIFLFIINKKITTEMMQSAEFFYRAFQKCFSFQHDRIEFILTLLKSKPESNKLLTFIHRQLNEYILSIGSKEMIYQYFASLGDYSDLRPQYFQNILNLTVKYDDHILNEKLFYLFYKIMGQCYEKWTFAVRNRAEDTMGDIIARFCSNYKGKSNDTKIKVIKDLILFLMKDVSNLSILVFKLVFIKQKFGNLISNNPLQLIFTDLIQKEHLLEKIIIFLQKNEEKEIKEKQILEVIRYINSKMVQKQDFILNHIQILTKYPEIYKDILAQSGHSQLQTLFNKIFELFQKNTHKISFKILKLVFEKYNYDLFSDNAKEFSLFQYKNQQKILKGTPRKLKHYQKLLDLMLVTTDLQLKTQISQYIVSLYVNHQRYQHSNGDEPFVEFMTELIEIFQIDVSDMKTDQDVQENVYVDLLLIEKCLEFTDILGCGAYKPHKSLVATSSINMVILNNITFGDDVAKVVKHNFPSNMLLIDVLEYIGLAFKCGPQEIILQKGQTFIHPIYNSRCLQDLNLNNVQIIAQRNLANRMDVPSVSASSSNKQINPIILKAIREIFYKFAYQGKMSLIQCTNYVKQSTGSECLSNDRRVRELMEENDKDNDGIFIIDDFIKYHQRNFMKYPNYFKDQIIKTFFNLRYRKNFTLYNVPLDLSHRYYLMMRFKISKSQNVYEKLFQLSESTNLRLSSKAKELLLLLPTYISQQNFLNNPLDFSNYSQFSIYYKLISILNALSEQTPSYNDKKTRIDLFLKYKNNEIIFNLIQNYNIKKEKSGYDQKCFLICLKILRSLINVRYLSRVELQSVDIGGLEIPSIPETNFFAEEAKKALDSGNILNFQTLLVLELTQNDINIQQIITYCFSPQEQIRKISSSFLYILSIQRKSSLNLFNTKIPETNNEEWFNLLCGIITNNIIPNYQQLLKESLLQLSQRKESLHHNYDNLMNGYLRILDKLISKCTLHDSSLENILKDLLEETLSEKNRTIIYEIIKKINIDICLEYFNDMLINILPSNQCRIKQKYLGLKNLGCICYINSILQQFFTIEKFKNMILTKNIPNNCPTAEVNGKVVVDDFMYQLQKLYYHLESSHKKYYIPKEFCYSYKDFQGKPINVAIQQDSHEFLNRLMQKSQQQLKKQQKLEKLQEIFLIKRQVEIQCDLCKNKILKIQNDYNLMIQVKDQNTLMDSLRKFTEKQYISDYFCQKCNKKVNKISKSTYLNQLPEIVIFNLQRIIYDPFKNEKIKVHSKLTFPNEINFQEFYKNSEMAIENVYNLKGVVIHSGNSQGGHYYSLIKTSKYGWLKFNDESVTSFDQKQIQRECFGGIEVSKDYIDVNYSSSAYILFYEKKRDEILVENIEVQNQFSLEIQRENVKLQKELQIHQSSFFNAIIYSYQSIKIPNIQEIMEKSMYYEGFREIQEERRAKLRKMKEIIQRSLSFLTVFLDIKSEVKKKIGQILIQLLFCLPEDNAHYLKSLNIQTFVQNMMTLQDPNYRQTLSSVLYSSIINYASFTNFSFLKITQENAFFIDKINVILENVQSKLFYSNLTKLDGFLNFCKKILMFQPIDFMSYMSDKLYFFKILDMIHGKQSLYQKYHPFVQNLPIALIENLSSHLHLYIQRKIINKGKHQDIEESLLNHPIQTAIIMQRSMLFNPSFYKRIFKLGYTNEHFINLINVNSLKDQHYTLMILEIYLNNLNKRQGIEKFSKFLEGLKSFLTIQDHLKQLRFSALLGFSQFREIDRQFCFQRCTNEQCSYYVSSLKYKKRLQISDKKPILEIIYQSHKYMSKSIQLFELLQLLLDLASSSQDIFLYIMSLPTNTYFQRHYFQFITDSLIRMEHAKEFYFQNKTERIENLKVNYSIIQEKIKKMEEKLPVQRYIIGRNESQTLMDQQKNELFDLSLTKYSTYVLQNEPEGYEQNKSLPRKLFPFYYSLHHKPEDKVNLFIKNKMNKGGDNLKSFVKDVKAEYTIYTLNGKVNRPFFLIFQYKGFKYEILVDEGDLEINFPYKGEGNIADLFGIREYKQEKVQVIYETIALAFNIQKESTQKSEQKMQEQKSDTVKITQQAAPNLHDKFICENCTFINEITNQNCQMCFQALF